jgi:S1-C subfamily serine protease
MKNIKLTLALAAVITPLVLVSYGLTKPLPSKYTWLPGSEGKGSGAFINTDGIFVTAYHIIGKNTKNVCVVVDGTCYPARFIDGDENKDVSISKVDISPLHTIKLGVLPTKIGDRFLKAGYPHEQHTEYAPDLKYGKVKCVGETCAVGGGMGEPPIMFGGLDITTHCLNPGDSGGESFHLTGGLLGINSAGDDESSALADVSSVKALLERNHIAYETSTVWTKPSFLLTLNASNSVKTVWIMADKPEISLEDIINDILSHGGRIEELR